jgi:hypothetical protein
VRSHWWTEQKGSRAYVPPNPKDDRALQTTLALLRGTEINRAFLPDFKADARELSRSPRDLALSKI